MSYVKTIKEDGVVSDIMAVALDPTLDATILHKSELVNGFTQTTAGVNALDAAAGKSLNDSLSNCATKTELADCIRMKYVNVTIPADATNVQASATIDSGYRFIGWCYCASVGWLGHVYASSNTSTAVFYTSSGSSSSERKFNAFYLLEKNA